MVNVEPTKTQKNSQAFFFAFLQQISFMMNDIATMVSKAAPAINEIPNIFGNNISKSK